MKSFFLFSSEPFVKHDVVVSPEKCVVIFSSMAAVSSVTLLVFHFSDEHNLLIYHASIKAFFNAVPQCKAVDVDALKLEDLVAIFSTHY